MISYFDGKINFIWILIAGLKCIIDENIEKLRKLGFIKRLIIKTKNKLFKKQ